MMDHTRMRFEAELNQRFAEGKTEIVAKINEENHLLAGLSILAQRQ